MGAAALTALAAIAYSFTLASFVDYLRLDTPLAYLPLMPVFALGLACVAARRGAATGSGEDGHELDFWVGVPLLVVALLMITVMPVYWSTYYWMDRIDVLSFAFFVCGAVALLYGAAWVWHLRTALLLLFLMWPALYLQALPKALALTTTVTNTILGAILASLPLGVSRGADPSLLIIHASGGAPLIVALGSVCSGANAVIGFVLIAGVVGSTLGGSLAQKVTWLVAGTTLAFTGNLVRVMAILALASAGHPGLALGAFHETIGVVVFTTVVSIALLLSPRFGLRFINPERGRGSASAQPVPRTSRRRTPGLAVSGLLLLMAGLATFADRNLSGYAGWITSDGRPATTPFASGSLPRGWAVMHLQSYNWAGQYFGSGSSFDRFAVVADNQMIVADVVRTLDAGSLSAYSLEACFLYHSFRISRSTRADLGHGVTAELLNYDDPASGKRWATVSWAWPVREGPGMRYERIALTSDLLRGSAGAPLAAPGHGLTGSILGLTSPVLDAHGGTSDPGFDAVNLRISALAAALVAVTSRAQPST